MCNIKFLYSCSLWNLVLMLLLFSFRLISVKNFSEKTSRWNFCRFGNCRNDKFFDTSARQSYFTARFTLLTGTIYWILWLNFSSFSLSEESVTKTHNSVSRKTSFESIQYTLEKIPLLMEHIHQPSPSRPTSCIKVILNE